MISLVESWINHGWEQFRVDLGPSRLAYMVSTWRWQVRIFSLPVNFPNWLDSFPETDAFIIIIIIVKTGYVYMHTMIRSDKNILTAYHLVKNSTEPREIKFLPARNLLDEVLKEFRWMEAFRPRTAVTFVQVHLKI